MNHNNKMNFTEYAWRTHKWIYIPLIIATIVCGLILFEVRDNIGYELNTTIQFSAIFAVIMWGSCLYFTYRGYKSDQQGHSR